MNWLSRFEAPIYAALRIVVGLMFAAHGVQKLFGVLPHHKYGAMKAEFGTQTWFGGVIELVCGLAMALGFKTRWAGFLASGTMAVAYWQFHQPNGGLPVQNDGELAVVYCFLFLFIAAKGSGIWSMSGAKDKSG